MSLTIPGAIKLTVFLTEVLSMQTQRLIKQAANNQPDFDCETPPDNRNASLNDLVIRNPHYKDIAGIVSVVRECEPYLTAHMSYIYWSTIHNHGTTCSVVERHDRIVGWCSISRISERKFFLHQLGLSSSWRGRGLATILVRHQVGRVRRLFPCFELEMTMDRKNMAAQRLFNDIAIVEGLRIARQDDPVCLLEPNCEEELFVLSPDA